MSAFDVRAWLRPEELRAYRENAKTLEYLQIPDDSEELLLDQQILRSLARTRALLADAKKILKLETPAWRPTDLIDAIAAELSGLPNQEVKG